MAMDEATIAEPITEATELREQKAGIETTYRDHFPLYEHFGIEKSDKADKALSEIWEYCKSQSPEKDNDSIILQVIKFNHELGTPGLGEAPYSKMLNYLKVYKQFKAAGEMMDKLKNE